MITSYNTAGTGLRSRLDAWCPRNAWPSFTAGRTVLAGWTATILCPRMGEWPDECAFILKESAVRSGYLFMFGIVVISWCTSWSLHPSVRWGIVGMPLRKLALALRKVSARIVVSRVITDYDVNIHWLTTSLSAGLPDWLNLWLTFTYSLAHRLIDLLATWRTGWST